MLKHSFLDEDIVLSPTLVFSLHLLREKERDMRRVEDVPRESVCVRGFT